MQLSIVKNVSVCIALRLSAITIEPLLLLSLFQQEEPFILRWRKGLVGGSKCSCHCLECKCVYSVEIVSQEHNSNSLFLCKNN